MTTYKTMEGEYVYKCCEMQITYSTKVKADERITAITSEKLADVFRNYYPDGTIEYCEIMYAALLDNQFRIIGIIRCSEGCLILLRSTLGRLCRLLCCATQKP